MSEQIKHECGIALIRLLKPLDFYRKKYGTPFYGIHKLYLLMEKQHNRGQDGAGVVNIKLDMPAGSRYFNRFRSNAESPIKEVFHKINEPIENAIENHPDKLNDDYWIKKNIPFSGELLLGHLRYGTYGNNSIEYCHPVLRQNNWKTRNIALAGNFNLTNVDELFQNLLELGQHPREKSDTVTVLEKIGHFLDEENEKLFKKFREEGYSKREITALISQHLDVQGILEHSIKSWDGGYVIGGVFGHGDAFVMRDPNGIRPAWYYHDDEVVVVASERPAMQTAFNISAEAIKELQPAHALIIKADGVVNETPVTEAGEKKACSFERIYFSRGSDVDIYKERMELGRLICPTILKAVDHDLKHTVLSFIPNTAETAFYGMVKGMEEFLRDVKKRKIKELGANLTDEKLDEILSIKPRIEKVAIKDAKLRTFITADSQRGELVSHVYDITYGTVKEGVDNLVVIDDSIVRGTTLKRSIVRMLARLKPKKLIVVSSAPQIRYPDCYGIDMARMGDFAAFNAAIKLLEENNREELLNEVYEKCKQQMNLPRTEIKNEVKAIYSNFTAEQISAKMSELLKPKDIDIDFQIIFQRIEDLHNACPEHTGDWYFTGNYPTPGGNKVVNRAFMNYMEKSSERAY